MSLISCVVQIPIDILLGAFVQMGSRAGFLHRYPFLALELARRQRAETELAKMSREELRAELGRDEKESQMEAELAAEEAAAARASGLPGNTGELPRLDELDGVISQLGRGASQRRQLDAKSAAVAAAGTGLVALMAGGDIGAGLGAAAAGMGPGGFEFKRRPRTLLGSEAVKSDTTSPPPLALLDSGDGGGAGEEGGRALGKSAAPLPQSTQQPLPLLSEPLAALTEQLASLSNSLLQPPPPLPPPAALFDSIATAREAARRLREEEDEEAGGDDAATARTQLVAHSSTLLQAPPSPTNEASIALARAEARKLREEEDEEAGDDGTAHAAAVRAAAARLRSEEDDAFEGTSSSALPHPDIYLSSPNIYSSPSPVFASATTPTADEVAAVSAARAEARLLREEEDAPAPPLQPQAPKSLGISITLQNMRLALRAAAGMRPKQRTPAAGSWGGLAPVSALEDDTKKASPLSLPPTDANVSSAALIPYVPPTPAQLPSQSPAPTPPHVRGHLHAAPANFQFDWVDAPPSLQRNCACLLFICGRHPSQTARYLAAARKESEEIRAVFNKKVDVKATAKKHWGLLRRLRRTLNTRHPSAAPVASEEAPPSQCCTCNSFLRCAVAAYHLSHATGGARNFVFSLGCCFKRSASVIAAQAEEAEERAWAALRKDAMAVAARRAAIATRTGGRLSLFYAHAHRALSLPNCSPTTALVQLPVFAFLAFCVYYLIVFGVYQSKSVVVLFVCQWLQSQAISAFIVFPLTLAIVLQLQLSVLPSWVPLLLWVPKLGPALAKQQLVLLGEQCVSDDAALSARMTHITLVRAAGDAADLPPDSALAGASVSAVLAASVSGSMRQGLRLAAAAGEWRAAVEAAEARAEKGLKGISELSAKRLLPPVAPPSLTTAELTAEERHELIVRRYLLKQLRDAERVRRVKVAVAAADAAHEEAESARRAAAWTAKLVRKASAKLQSFRGSSSSLSPRGVLGFFGLGGDGGDAGSGGRAASPAEGSQEGALAREAADAEAAHAAAEARLAAAQDAMRAADAAAEAVVREDEERRKAEASSLSFRLRGGGEGGRGSPTGLADRVQRGAAANLFNV